MDIGSLINKYNIMDCSGLFSLIDNEAISLTVFDPQYRGILDKMGYGNEGENRGKERVDLKQMSDDTIKSNIKEINRVLKPNGYLFLWVDKFHLVEGVQHWFEDTHLKTVDLLTWNKEKMGMGYRLRNVAEYCLIVQKTPIKKSLSKANWKLHNIRNVLSEKITDKIHTHQKPYNIQKELIQAVTDPDDLVLDPCMGSGVILKICQEINRNFIGCDLKYPLETEGNYDF
jgi:site-specific DNA-methyltransferase (adenine-specific)